MGKSVWALVFLATAVQARLRLDPLVDTKQGLVKGLRAEDGDYAMFLGIPYGKVDSDNPFGVAQPHPKFEQVYEAYNDPNICPQIEEFSKEIRGTLDCLRLNIYVPNKASARNKLPVLVWIHGGGYQYGTGTKYASGPRFLVRHDVILVTLNYRLGPYGFMCLDIPEVSGNQGLKDQALALRWVKNNIEEFGGDINKITVYGESAGAASIELHIASKNEKLFDQAILGSGSIFGRWTVGGIDNTVPSKLAKQLGYETEDVKEALAFLAQTDVKLVVAAANEVSIKLTGCVENEFDNVDEFLTEHPFGMKTLPKAKNMGILSGYNDNELIISYITQSSEYFASIDPFEEHITKIGFSEEKADFAYKLIRHFYIGDESIGEDVKWDLMDFSSDVTFNHPVQKSIERFQASGAKNVYHYVFEYVGDRNFVKVRYNITEGGASHADELGYVFDIVVLDDAVSEKDQIVVDRITTLWTNFVKHGNPTPETTELIPVQWPAVTKDSLANLRIGEELAVGGRPFHDRLAFWDLFYETYKEELSG